MTGSADVKRIFFWTIFAVAALSALPVATAFAQSGQCGGNLIAHRPITMPNGTRIGELQLYYNPSNGRNCARTVKGGPAWGVPSITAVSLARCRNRSDRECGIDLRFDVQPYYRHFAGPVRVPARNSCIRAAGYIDFRGGRHWANTIYGHCGG
jgi:hypothetical protein